MSVNPVTRRSSENQQLVLRSSWKFMGRARKTEIENNANAYIGARVVVCRKERGISQTRLAEELEVSVAHPNALEARRYTWSAATIQHLTHIFGVSASMLLGADPPEDDLIRE